MKNVKKSGLALLSLSLENFLLSFKSLRGLSFRKIQIYHQGLDSLNTDLGPNHMLWKAENPK